MPREIDFSRHAMYTRSLKQRRDILDEDGEELTHELDFYFTNHKSRKSEKTAIPVKEKKAKRAK